MPRLASAWIRFLSRFVALTAYSAIEHLEQDLNPGHESTGLSLELGHNLKDGCSERFRRIGVKVLEQTVQPAHILVPLGQGDVAFPSGLVKFLVDHSFRLS